MIFPKWYCPLALKYTSPTSKFYWMDYRLVLSNSKFVTLQFLLAVDNDVRYDVTLGDFQRWPLGEKCSLTYQCLISGEKRLLNSQIVQNSDLAKLLVWFLPLTFMLILVIQSLLFVLISFEQYLKNVFKLKWAEIQI